MYLGWWWYSIWLKSVQSQINPISDQSNLEATCGSTSHPPCSSGVYLQEYSWINVLEIQRNPFKIYWNGLEGKPFKHRLGKEIGWTGLKRKPFKHRFADGFQDTVLGPVLNPGQRRVKSRNANLRKEMKMKCTEKHLKIDDLSGWSWGHPKDSCRVFTPGRTHACTVWAGRAG